MLGAADYRAAFQSIGIALSDVQIGQLQHYARRIQTVNQVMNLTAVADDDGILWRHFIDSCQPLKFIALDRTSRIVDIGTGAGFPGLPLAIVSAAGGSLLDALNKRVQFLNQVIGELNLTSIDAWHGRVEAFGRLAEQRASYDYAFSRAVTELPVLIEYAMPLLKVGGRFIAYKAADCDDEVASSRKALTLLNSKISEISEYTDNYNIKRKLVVVEKMAATPAQYPRRVGIAAKRPLK